MQINGYHFTLLQGVVVVADLELHALVGYFVVSYLTDYNPLYGLIGSLIPNIDLLFDVWPNTFPFVHRGLLHTPLFLLVVTGIVFYYYGKKVALPLAIGYLVELVVDVFESNDGIMWLHPFSNKHYAIPIPHMNTWVIGVTALLAVVYFLRNN